MRKVLLGLLVYFSCTFPVFAKQSMVCFDNQASCNNDCIAKGDMKCVERCTSAAEACVAEENARQAAERAADKAAYENAEKADERDTAKGQHKDLTENKGRLVGNNEGKPKVIYGPEQLEAIAVCWPNPEDEELWRCDGPIQDTIDYDEPLETQLGYVGCEKPRLTDGAHTVQGKRAIVYLCGWGLWTEVDVAKKYGNTVQRNKYQCTGSTEPTDHCRDNYQMTE